MKRLACLLMLLALFSACGQGKTDETTEKTSAAVDEALLDLGAMGQVSYEAVEHPIDLPRYGSMDDIVCAPDGSGDLWVLCNRGSDGSSWIGLDRQFQQITAPLPPKAMRVTAAFLPGEHASYALWLEGTYHVTCGRFDKYMAKYLKPDDRDDEKNLLLMRDFFLSFNVDSDMYPGVQQGDNGQSMVLGGKLYGGGEVWNLLSELCLKACAANKLIDPKINMRVSAETPIERYVSGSRLTAAGMGFPQYSNDDVVIPGLIALGYAEEDAYDYGVAACWEFIVPGKGCDVANIDALSFPAVVDDVLHGGFADIATEKELEELTRAAVAARCDKLIDVKNLWFVPAPFLSLFFDTPNEAGDISCGSVYNNFGLHGTGLSTAADALAAMAQYVLEDGTVSAKAFIATVDADYQDETGAWLLPLLRNEAPKIGAENGARAEHYMAFLLKTFADALEGRENCRGGVWRAGTGSAMYYLWHADELGASPDGRRKGEPFATNYSPSLFAKTGGPVSVIRAFAAPDLQRNINGGPLTLEFDASVFKAEDACEKLGTLVRYYILRGGHQLQLNAVSRETLLDAQAHPEQYPHLIVRVWGWSAYFCELDKPYQDHVIARCEYAL